MEKFGIEASEWDRMGSVYVLRSCILTPYLTGNTNYEEYWQNFMDAMKLAISRVYAGT
jgi:tyrosine decarboxylase